MHFAVFALALGLCSNTFAQEGRDIAPDPAPPGSPGIILPDRPADVGLTPDYCARGFDEALADADSPLAEGIERDALLMVTGLTFRINSLRSVGCAEAAARLGRYALKVFDLNEHDTLLGHRDPRWQRVALPTAHAMSEAGEIEDAVELFHEVLDPAPTDIVREMRQGIGINLAISVGPAEHFAAHRALGYLQLKTGDSKAAAASFAAAETVANSGSAQDDLLEVAMTNERFADVIVEARGRMGLIVEAFGKDHPEYPRLTLMMLDALRFARRTTEAERLVGENLTDWQTRYGPHDARTLALLDALAASLVHHGRYGEAERVLTGLLALSRDGGHQAGSDHARRLGMMGQVHVAVGLVTAAERNYREALNLYNDTRGDFGNFLAQSRGEVEVRAHLAELLEETGRPAEAATLHFENFFATIPDIESSADAIFSARRALLASDDKDTFLGDVPKLLRALERSEGPLPPEALKGLLVSAEALRRSGEIEKAARHVAEAVEVFETNQIDTFTLSANERRQRDRQAHEIARHLADIAWTPAREVDAADHGRLRDEAFRAAQLRETASGQAISTATARLAASDAGLSRIIGEYESALRDQRVFEALLARVSAKAAAGIANGSIAVAVLSERRARLNARIMEFRSQIATDFPQFFDLIAPAPVSVTEIIGAASPLISETEALVLLMPPQGRKPGYVWAISREGIEWAKIDLTESEMQERIAQFRTMLDRPDRTARPSTPFDRDMAHEIYLRLFGDPGIAGFLESRPDWILAPQGMFLSLPFAALVTTRPIGDDGDPKALRETAWLGIERAIAVVPSVATLRNRGRSGRDGDVANHPRFFGLADPLFAGAANASGPLRPATAYFDGATASIEEVRRLSQLPYSLLELELMGTALGAGADDVLRGREANEQRLAALSDAGVLAQAGVVLLATHALIAGEFEGLTEPALALTPPEGQPRLIDPEFFGDEPGVSVGAGVIEGVRIDDGLLTASEAATLKLNADWVILSACNTAAGTTNGAEGLSGLARSFMFAGARSLLVSHWPVRDAVAAHLTTNVVSINLDDPAKGRVRSLREAMEITLRDESIKGGANPSVWASFQIVGVDPLQEGR
ncbi:CHAT domain-containing protein [Sedimentitalea sp. HM32M-2]|uniref:CHAT domain-containing protein n=1 Tax=Sedimentitalea sp. HM32M-2 TaxID=3351566 RepID=UPI00362BED96